MEGIERTTRRGNSSSAAALRDRLGELDKVRIQQNDNIVSEGKEGI